MSEENIVKWLLLSDVSRSVAVCAVAFLVGLGWGWMYINYRRRNTHLKKIKNVFFYYYTLPCFG